MKQKNQKTLKIDTIIVEIKKHQKYFKTMEKQ